MSREKFQIAPARSSDLNEILALLTAVDLPHDGVADHLDGFVVARDSERQMIGCAGVERFGAFGLVRSVAVARDLQRTGLGSSLVSAVLRMARDAGVSEAVLLTTTARDFFSRRFSFEETSRKNYEQPFAASSEWHLPRCSSAVVMRLNLGSMVTKA